MAGAADGEHRDGVWTPGRRALTLGSRPHDHARRLRGARDRDRDARRERRPRRHRARTAGCSARSSSAAWSASSPPDVGRPRRSGPRLRRRPRAVRGRTAGRAAPRRRWARSSAARARAGLGAGAIPAVAYVAIGRAYPAVAAAADVRGDLDRVGAARASSGPRSAARSPTAFGWRWVFLGLLPARRARRRDRRRRALHALGAPGGDEPRRPARVDALLLALGAGLVLGGASARSLVVAVPLVVVGCA